MKTRIGLLVVIALSCLCCGVAITASVQTPLLVEAAVFKPFTKSPNAVRNMLHEQAPTLNANVVNTVVAALECAKKNETQHNHIITVIDYSLPSNQKRLWIFDAEKEKLLFHTHVSHGFKSGETQSNYFSNIENSKTSSIGVYLTANTYYGRYGAALKLQGVEENFNDKAYERFIVMHGSWYVSEKFIKKYGRAGRSWGCPSVTRELVVPITQAIKDKSFLIIYYPEREWLAQSKFLNCSAIAEHKISADVTKGEIISAKDEQRGTVIFIDANGNDDYDKDEAIVVIKAQDYSKMFNSQAPLKRMLRRQINGNEYIALNQQEFDQLQRMNVKLHHFAVPEVKQQRGYWATEIKFIKQQPHKLLKSTEKFIRWLGL